MRDKAFTLIELIVVLLILSVLAALAAPSMGGWSDAQKLRGAGDEFVSATRWARAQAIISATTLSLTIDSSAQTYTVTSAGTNAANPLPLSGPYTQNVKVPESFKIALADGGDGNGAISFYPNGASTPAKVSIVSARGQQISVVATTPAQPFVVDSTN